MHDSKFIAYVGHSDIHDGCIVDVYYEKNKVTVHLMGGNGRSFPLVFTNVSEFKAIQPVGMMSYALVEMSAPFPSRKFVFANWADDNPSQLEIVAEGIDIVD